MTSTRRNIYLLAVAAMLGCITLAACTTPKLTAVVAAAPAPVACADFSFPIYFNSGSDQLTDSANAVIAAETRRAAGCAVSKVEVLGLADADGPKARNLALSRRRAAHVAAALKAVGLPAPSFDIDAIGEAGAKAVDGAPEPLRRRTEVVVHAAPHKA